jgi:uncharacterized protein YqeY
MVWADDFCAVTALALSRRWGPLGAIMAATSIQTRLRAAEVARRKLTDADIADIVSAEINDRRSAADDYDRLGRGNQSARLRQEADVLTVLVEDS